jgi:hypothetical protein
MLISSSFIGDSIKINQAADERPIYAVVFQRYLKNKLEYALFRIFYREFLNVNG